MEEDTVGHASVLELCYGRTRCFLIHGKLLIDTDWAGTLPAYLACLQKHGVRAEDVRYLLITHYHPDHCGIAADLMALGTKLLVMDVQKDAVHQADPVFLQDHRHRFTPIPDEGTILLAPLHADSGRGDDSSAVRGKPAVPEVHRNQRRDPFNAWTFPGQCLDPSR